ncbi:MAG: ImmA/IrrE family metallo-endopeptidase [Terriglobales bacterium]
MYSNQPCSEPQSDLVRLFVERSGIVAPHNSPDQVITELVERTARKARGRSQARRLQRFLDDRNIFSVEYVDDGSYDGMLDPMGSTFSNGFKMRLRSNLSEARARFTIAHEACHTFFYQLAPEIKFRPHETDDLEERLCNLGASVLLIPSAALTARSRKLPISLDSLQQLAAEFAVSLPTMLLRLRGLGLWKCQLSSWHRSVSGEFVLDRFYGGRRVECKWHDASVLERVWKSNEAAFETGFVYTESRGAKAFKPIAYHVQRSSQGVTVLWGSGIRPTVSTYPLLEIARAA